MINDIETITRLTDEQNAALTRALGYSKAQHPILARIALIDAWMTQAALLTCKFGHEQAGIFVEEDTRDDA